MSRHYKFRVYLAGPITGCNEFQVHQWREDIKQKYGKNLDFIDPSTFIDPSGESLDQMATTASQIVEADLLSIRQADGLLANMWRESIGSAIGVVHANLAGKPVVVADPNHLESKTLAFYADAVEDAPLKAAKVLLDLLRAEADWTVLKLSGQTEQFNRKKLMNAIRSACRRAECDDIVGPRLVLSKVIARLKESSRSLKKQFPTGVLDSEILEALKELENDPVHPPVTIEGVSVEWERVRVEKHIDPLSHTPSSGASESSASQIGVEISSGKSHGTLWGKTVNHLYDIPSADARQVFEIIRQTPGVTRITLGYFGRQESRSSCKATVDESTTPCLIEGRLFDRGTKGTMQTFQVRVQFDSNKKEILQHITVELNQNGLLA